jgi:hypothetical protein
MVLLEEQWHLRLSDGILSMYGVQLGLIEMINLGDDRVAK